MLELIGLGFNFVGTLVLILGVVDTIGTVPVLSGNETDRDKAFRKAQWKVVASRSAIFGWALLTVGFLLQFVGRLCT